MVESGDPLNLLLYIDFHMMNLKQKTILLIIKPAKAKKSQNTFK